jgi:hypothetical protein
MLIGILVRKLGGEVVITAKEVVEAATRPPTFRASQTDESFTITATP